jgi:hypothetical protein
VVDFGVVVNDFGSCGECLVFFNSPTCPRTTTETRPAQDMLSPQPEVMDIHVVPLETCGI